MARIANFATGPLAKAPEKRKAERRLRDPAYLAWLHELCCTVGGTKDDLIAHHVTVGRGRMGVKEDDSLAIPLSSRWHNDFPDSLHMLGERNFWTRWGIDPFPLARDLYSLFRLGGSQRAGNEVLFAHRAMGSMRVRHAIKVFEHDA